MGTFRIPCPSFSLSCLSLCCCCCVGHRKDCITFDDLVTSRAHSHPKSSDKDTLVKTPLRGRWEIKSERGAPTLPFKWCWALWGHLVKDVKSPDVCGYNKMLLRRFLSEPTLLSAPPSSLILGSVQDYTYTQVHILCGLRVMCQGCLSKLSMFVALLERQRAQDCANECLAEGWWWRRRLLGSLGTGIRVFGGSCIHLEGLAVFVILAGPQSYN